MRPRQPLQEGGDHSVLQGRHLAEQVAELEDIADFRPAVARQAALRAREEVLAVETDAAGAGTVEGAEGDVLAGKDEAVGGGAGRPGSGAGPLLDEVPARVDVPDGRLDTAAVQPIARSGPMAFH